MRFIVSRTCAAIKRAGASINYHYKNSLFPIKAMNNENIELRGGICGRVTGSITSQSPWLNEGFASYILVRITDKLKDW